MIYTESHLKAVTLQIKHHYQWNLQCNLPFFYCDFDHLAFCLQNLDQLCQVYSFSLSNSYRWMMSQWIRETNVSFLFLPSKAFLKSSSNSGWSVTRLDAEISQTFAFKSPWHTEIFKRSSDSSLKERGGGSWQKKVTTLTRFHRLWTRDEGKVDVCRRQVFFDQSTGVGANAEQNKNAKPENLSRHVLTV